MLEHRSKSFDIDHVANLQGSPFYGVAIATRQIVVGHWGISSFCQCFAGVASYKSGTACNKYVQMPPVLPNRQDATIYCAGGCFCKTTINTNSGGCTVAITLGMRG